MGLAEGEAAGVEPMMVDDIDIWRSAKLLVEEHGNTATFHAAMKADAMLDKGDLDGYAVWKRIVRAVREMLDRELRGAVH